MTEADRRDIRDKYKCPAGRRRLLKIHGISRERPFTGVGQRVRSTSAIRLLDEPESGGVGGRSKRIGTAGGSHLPRAGPVFVLPGGRFGAVPSFRAPTEIEPAAG